MIKHLFTVSETTQIFYKTTAVGTESAECSFIIVVKEETTVVNWVQGFWTLFTLLF